MANSAHSPGFFLDGDESHGLRRVVVDQFVDLLGAQSAQGGKKAQPQILFGHLVKKIRIERGIFWLERPQQHAFAIEQFDMLFVPHLSAT
jgi:hypothetical protein